MTPTPRHLRRNATEAERRLWQHLRNRQLDGHKVRRQYPVAGFVADFACLEKRLIVELDGGQHAEREAEDARRTAALEAAGFRVVRFWNHEVLNNTEGVLQHLRRILSEP